MNKKITIQPQAPLVPEKDAFVLELQRLLSTGRSKRQGNCVVCAQQICTTYCLKSKDSPMQGLSLCTWEKYYGKKKNRFKGRICVHSHN